jgi:chemosensory pili system protein ChpC
VNSDVEEVYSLLIPLQGDRLIVPRACVAEVVRFGAPKPADVSLDWLLGTVDWNGRDLPIVSYEGALGKEVPPANGRTRVVIFVASTGQLRTGYFGVLTQGFPQLVRVNRDVLRLEATDGWPDSAPVLCRVRMINEFPLIPDLEKLELMLAREDLPA